MLRTGAWLCSPSSIKSHISRLLVTLAAHDMVRRSHASARQDSRLRTIALWRCRSMTASIAWLWRFAIRFPCRAEDMSLPVGHQVNSEVRWVATLLPRHWAFLVPRPNLTFFSTLSHGRQREGWAPCFDDLADWHYSFQVIAVIHPRGVRVGQAMGVATGRRAEGQFELLSLACC